MSIIGSINGNALLAMPLVPGPRQVEWSAQDLVGSVTATFTGKQQFQNWQSSWLEAVVTMPPMQRVNAAAWIAFLLQAQGQSAVFYFGDSQGATPQGSALGAGVTAGSFQGGYSLTTSGWTPNQSALFLPNDFLQIGTRLYRCMDQATSDSTGSSTFAIWPQIREIPPNGTAIVTNNAQGLFRMAANVRKWDQSYMRTYGLSFQIREAT